MAVPKIDSKATAKNTKIVFGDDGEVVNSAGGETKKSKNKKNRKLSENEDIAVKAEDGSENGQMHGEEEEEDYFAKREKKKASQKNGNIDNDTESNTKWYFVVSGF